MANIEEQLKILGTAILHKWVLPISASPSNSKIRFSQLSDNKH